MEKNINANLGGSLVSGVLALLGTALIILKLLGMIQITWFWALLPLVIACLPILIGIVLILFAGLLFLVGALFSIFDCNKKNMQKHELTISIILILISLVMMFLTLLGVISVHSLLLVMMVIVVEEATYSFRSKGES